MCMGTNMGKRQCIQYNWSSVVCACCIYQAPLPLVMKQIALRVCRCPGILIEVSLRFNRPAYRTHICTLPNVSLRATHQLANHLSHSNGSDDLSLPLPVSPLKGVVLDSQSQDCYTANQITHISKLLKVWFPQKRNKRHPSANS